VHLLGKGVLRFHAVYWPAILLSAGLPLPTDLLVHDYLTVGGAKISKSAGNAAAADPAALVEAYGTDAVRWWLLREVPRAGDADFTPRRLAARADADLAGGIGNLVHRVTTLLHRRCGGRVPDRAPAVLSGLGEVCHAVPGQVDAALEAYDVRRATGALWTIVDEANRALDHTRPWEPARSGGAGSVLAALHHACRVLGEELRPFLPGSAARITAQCTPVAGVLPEPQHLFGRVHTRPPHRV
jgi:methionyl-tRNA synthetase